MCEKPLSNRKRVFFKSENIEKLTIKYGGFKNDKI